MKKIFNKDIKAVLFDMDGVVIDSERLYSLSETNLLAQYGVEFDDSDWLKIKGCTESQFYDLVYSKFNIKVPRKKLMRMGREFLKDTFTKKLSYMDGFHEIQSILKKKYKLALVTSTGEELVKHVDKLLSIKKKFDLMITSIDTSLHKPNPDPYLTAMNRLNFDSHECIVIEDSIQGIKAGKAAGCYVIALEGSLDKKFLTEADKIIPNFHTLKNELL